MAGFYLYMPGRKSAHDLAAVPGLAGICRGSPTSVYTPRGPDGAAEGGTLFFWAGRVASLGACAYQPERQRWEPCKPRRGAEDGANAECGMRNAESPDTPHSEFRTPHSREAGAFWMGVDLSRPPGPDDLRLPVQRDGSWVELGDGGRWLVPEAARLPRKWGLGDDGEQTRMPLAPYAAFCAGSERMYRWMSDVAVGRVPDEPLTERELWEYCVEALAINYRLNADLVDFLGLIVEDARVEGGRAVASHGCMAIVRATLGITALEEVESDQKKTA